MKKIQLFIFTMLSVITFSNSDISGPRVYTGGSIGLGTNYDMFYKNSSLYTTGLDLEFNVAPIWSYKINEKSSVDFGPTISLLLRNHVIFSNKRYLGWFGLNAGMFFDYNIKSTEKITIYLGAKLGGAAYLIWTLQDIEARGTLNFDIHSGVKLNNDTLRLGGSFGTKGLVFEVGKIF